MGEWENISADEDYHKSSDSGVQAKVTAGNVGENNNTALIKVKDCVYFKNHFVVKMTKNRTKVKKLTLSLAKKLNVSRSTLLGVAIHADGSTSAIRDDDTVDTIEDRIDTKLEVIHFYKAVDFKQMKNKKKSLKL